jgi:hypothetical protein
MDEVKLRNSENKRCRDSRMKKKEKQKAAGWLEPAGVWAEHGVVQRREPHAVLPRHEVIILAPHSYLVWG